MKSLIKLPGVILAVWAATAGMAHAAPAQNVPEPGSMALVGLAIAALLVVSRKGRK